MIRTRPGHGTTLIEFCTENGSVVTSLESLPLIMYFGRARIPAAGIAAMFTAEAHRHHGYARQCMEAAIELQRKDGAPLSFLFGIPNFYEKFGYTVVMPWYAVEVPLPSARDIPREPCMQEASSLHLEALHRLYEDTVGSRTGPLVRDPAEKVRPQKLTRWRSASVTRILAGPDNRVRGYVCINKPDANTFEIGEVGAEDDSAREEIAVFLFHEALRRGKDRFTAVLPPDDPFALFLRRYGSQNTVEKRASGGGMARVLDFPSLCAALEPVFLERLGALKREIVPASLTFATEAHEASVSLRGAAPLARISCSLAPMTQLFFGYGNLAQDSLSGVTHGLQPEAGQRLFPDGFPFTYLKDRF